METPKSKLSFIFSMISLCLFGVTFFTILALVLLRIWYRMEFKFAMMAAGFIIIAMGFSSIVGFIFALLSIKEPNNSKKTAGFIINTLGMLLFILIIINAFVQR